jgi:molybdate transport system substrate-binding protein
MCHVASTAAILVLALAAQRVADAAELQIWTARAGATVLMEIGPEFERATCHELMVSSGLPTDFMKRLGAGERFDILISTAGPVDALIEKGRIRAQTRTSIARSGIGVLVRTGARRPDIGSVASFKQALLEAKSVAYLKVGSGMYLDGLLERLGIADVVRSKAVRPDTDIVAELVAKGEIELGVVVITQILTTPGVDYVGPLPADIQSYVSFVGGVSTDTKAPEAAQDLLRFLTGPRSAAVMNAQGMEPAARPAEPSLR